MIELDQKKEPLKPINSDHIDLSALDLIDKKSTRRQEKAFTFKRVFSYVVVRTIYRPGAGSFL